MNTENINVLTNRQKEVYLLWKSGMSQAQIAREIGTSPQNISSILKYANDRIKNGRKPRSKRKNRKSNRINSCKKYENCDMSMLTERQRRILQYRIAGKTGSEIAKIEGVSEGTIWATLDTAVCKITCEFGEKKEYQRLYNKEYRKNNKEKVKELSRNSAEKYRENHPSDLVDKHITMVNGRYIVLLRVAGKNRYIVSGNDLEEVRKIRDFALKKRNSGDFFEWFEGFKRNGRSL